VGQQVAAEYHALLVLHPISSIFSELQLRSAEMVFLKFPQTQNPISNTISIPEILNMSFMKALFFLFFFTLAFGQIFSQDLQSLDPLPTTRDEFVKSEPAVIALVDWLETTPLGQETDKRKGMNALLLTWLTNAPTVTVEVNTKVTPMSKKNPDLLTVFLGGWTKYSLQNSYSKDPVKCNLAGIRSVLKVYKLGMGVKKDKDIEKLVELDVRNELEAWIATNLKK
jgi:hypothetical protein